MKPILFLISLLIFTGCQKQPVNLQHMSKQTRVGIVSAGLDEMKVQTEYGRGTYAQIDISDMNLDRIFEQKLIKKLSSTKMNPLRVSPYGGKDIKYSQTMDEFKYEFKSFWQGLYYYAKQERWNQKGNKGATPLYTFKKDGNNEGIIKNNQLDYLIIVVEPYDYKRGLQSQIRISTPILGKPTILFEPMVSMQTIKDGELRFVTRLDKKGYRQVDVYNDSPWKNNGKLHLTPEIREEIEGIILKQMDRVVEDVYYNVARYQQK